MPKHDECHSYSFNCPETQRGSEIFLEKKWQMIKEEKAFRKIVGCMKDTELRKL